MLGRRLSFGRPEAIWIDLVMGLLKSLEHWATSELKLAQAQSASASIVVLFRLLS